jgi:hypothetical protein
MSTTASSPDSGNTLSGVSFMQRGYDVMLVHPTNLGANEGGSARQDVFAMNPSVTVTDNTGKSYLIPAELDFFSNAKFTAASAASTWLIQASSDIGTSLSASIGVSADDGEGQLFACSASSQTTTQRNEMSDRTQVYGTTQAEFDIYELKIQLASGKYPPLSADFSSDVTGLTSATVETFIKTYGTHYPTDMTFGGLAILSYKIDQSSFSTLMDKSVNLTGDISAGLGILSGNASMSSSTNVSAAFATASSKMTHSILSVGGTVTVGNDDTLSSDWQPSVEGSPVPIKVTLAPLSDLIADADKKAVLQAGIQSYLLNSGNVPLPNSIIEYGDIVVLQPLTGVAPQGLNLVCQPGVEPSGTKTGVQSTIASPAGATHFFDLGPGGTQLDAQVAGLQLANPGSDTSKYLLKIVSPGGAIGAVDYSQPLCFQLLNSTPALYLDAEGVAQDEGLVGPSANPPGALSTQWVVTPLYDRLQPDATYDAYANLAHQYNGPLSTPPLNFVHGDPVSIKRMLPDDPKNHVDKRGNLMVLSNNLVSKGDYSQSPVGGNNCFFRVMLVSKGNS